MVMFQIVR